MATKKCSREKAALKSLLKFVTSSKVDTGVNPYSIPEVKRGFKAAGMTVTGDPLPKKAPPGFTRYGERKRKR